MLYVRAVVPFTNKNTVTNGFNQVEVEKPKLYFLCESTESS